MPDTPYSRAELHQLAMRKLLSGAAISPSEADRAQRSMPEVNGRFILPARQISPAGAERSTKADPPKKRNPNSMFETPSGVGPGTLNDRAIGSPQDDWAYTSRRGEPIGTLPGRYLNEPSRDINLPRESIDAQRAAAARQLPVRLPSGAGPGTLNDRTLASRSGRDIRLPDESGANPQRRLLEVGYWPDSPDIYAPPRGAGPGTDNSIEQRYSGVQTNIFGEPGDLASADTLHRDASRRYRQDLGYGDITLPPEAKWKQERDRREREFAKSQRR